MPALLRLVTNSQLIAEDQQARGVGQDQEIILNLSSHVEKCWQAAYQAKQPIQTRMLKSLRQREGQYESDVISQIRQQGGSEIFMLLTLAKCRAAEAWIRDVMLQQGENPWGIEPTPIAELPPLAQQIVKEQVFAEAQLAGWQVTPEQLTLRMEFLAKRATEIIQELAKKAAMGMERRIDDQLKEGKWKGAFSDILYDFTTNLAAIVKGPVVRRRKTLKWDTNPQGIWIPLVDNRLILEFNRVPPLDLYPSPACRDVNDGYLCEHHRLHRRKIVSMIGVPGYDEVAIRKVLEEHGRGGLKNWLFDETERAQLEGRPNESQDPEGTISAIEFSGSVQGRWLTEWGMQGEIDPDLEYDANVWKIGRQVVRAVLNPHPLGVRPYHKACWDNMPGSFWGEKSLPEILTDTQAMCNGAARAISNNQALSSGPQVEVNVDRVPPGQDVHHLWPWKIWQTSSDKTGNGHPAVRFHDAPSNTQELIAVYDRFERVADNVSGVPSYSYGDTNQGGAGRTATGLSMLMSNAARGIKMGIAHLDEGIVEPAVGELYYHNMQHDPDPQIKGDLMVVPRGATALLVKEQMQIRRTEFLAATANPLDAPIIGMAGRAELLRETARSMDLPADKIVPSEEEMQLQTDIEQNAGVLVPQQQPPGAAPAQAGTGPTRAAPRKPDEPGARPQQPPRPPLPGATPLHAPRTLTHAGQPAAGQDVALYNR